ncbi:hypothetical protein [Halomonas kalidii]|uniref:Uncharacterized protein n=1 Tax=Halomonas kalidii TaxID=3043293 RepID=A0ABT6VIW1_9GAMM|nr:hypothetical protein [Halomonas kalidii]MDI5933625.1 hypothetical protein [Halomonas kalidii]
MISEEHPIYFICDIFRGMDAQLFFSRYNYVRDSLLDDREVFSVGSSMIGREWLNDEINKLQENQELAFHSLFIRKGRKYHVPMVDFSIKEWEKDYVISRMLRLIGKRVVTNMAVYDSGRSFHGYSKSILSPKEWLEFMGRLLLVNPSGEEEIIDSRWVGHRVIGGYSSLRLSNNTHQYVKLPSRIKFP